MMRFILNIILLTFLFSFFLPVLNVANADVILIITERQKKKQSRWTIADWFRQKEIMRQQDAWLKMHTDPGNANFSPEIHFEYARLMTDEKLKVKNGAELKYLGKDDEKDYTQIRSNMFLSDIVSAGLGIPTLNIDIGVGGYIRDTRRLEMGYGPLFRLIGSSNQDNSLVVGAYYTNSSIRVPGSLEMHPDETNDLDAEFNGWVYNGSLQMYLLSFLGFEGIYRYYPELNSSSLPQVKLKGDMYQVNAFIELFMLRISGGVYKLEKEYTIGGKILTQTESGYMASGAIYF